MKKALAILLAFVMLLSLCACNNSENQATDPSDSSQSTTNETENTTGGTETPADGTEGTEGTTEATQSTEEQTTPPTDEPTTPPTQAPTEEPTTPPATCSHNWKDATCTTPKTCTKCGATEGKASGHNWKDATCTAPKTCSKCNATEGNAGGHSWKDATCTAPKTCSKCGATEGNAGGHSWKDATCTAPKTCSKCNATEGSAKGHSYSNGACSVCGTTDPSYKQLTDGLWSYITDECIYTITFDATGLATITHDWRVSKEAYQAQQAQIKELEDTYGDDWMWEWYGDFYYTRTIGGIEYYYQEYRNYSTGYAESNGVIILDDGDYEFGQMTRTAGNQLTITSGGGEFGNVGAVYTCTAN